MGNSGFTFKRNIYFNGRREKNGEGLRWTSLIEMSVNDYNDEAEKKALYFLFVSKFSNVWTSLIEISVNDYNDEAEETALYFFICVQIK
jgi:hypothetical protein